MPDKAIAQIRPRTRVIYCKARATHKAGPGTVYQISGNAVKHPSNGGTEYRLQPPRFGSIHLPRSGLKRLSAGPRPRQFND